jgi:hypothetical protein
VEEDMTHEKVCWLAATRLDTERRIEMSTPLGAAFMAWSRRREDLIDWEHEIGLHEQVNDELDRMKRIRPQRRTA